MKYTLLPIVAFGIITASSRVAAAPEVSPADHAAHAAADPAAHQPAAETATGDSALANQLSALRDKVAKMERVSGQEKSMAADSGGMPMSEKDPATNKTAMKGTGKDMGMMGGKGKMKMGADAMSGGAQEADSGGMGKMSGMGGMGMMKRDKMKMDKMGGMSGMTGMGMMQMDKMKMAGMMGMSPMSGGMQGMASNSALPGFPGASHLYHLGATGFFLDHETHIALTTEQTAALNKIKEQNALATGTSNRLVEQAEQELWQLTSTDQPDIAAIEAKAAEISKIEVEKRVAFIRAVGEAAKLLTEDQRKSLTGFAPPAPAPTMGGMEGM